MAQNEEPEEPIVLDLLPNDEEPEPGPRKIAERRVVGWRMSTRLIERRVRRPAGNSRRFWQKIEEDDPFMPKPDLRRVRQDHTLYPADRIDRLPPPPPEREPPKRMASKPKAPSAPKPTREAAPPPPPAAPQRPAPQEPVFGRDTRTVPTPRNPNAPPPEPPAEVDRRPPIVPHHTGKKGKSGRIQVSQASGRPQGGGGMMRSAAQAREEKEAARKKAEPKEPPKLRGLDSVLGLLGNLAQAEKQHAEGHEVEAIRGDVQQPRAAKPTRQASAPKRVASKPSAAKAPKREAEAPPVDRTPPAPKKAPKKDAEPPGPPASAGNLNDLFGGGGDRVRIGKRQMPKGKPDGD